MQWISKGHSSKIREIDSVLFAISLGHCFTHWYPSTFYLILPFLAKELNLSYSEMGFIITARHLTGTLINLPAGMMVDLSGKRGLIMALSLAWAGIPYFFMGMTSSYFLILLCMVMVGIGLTLWHPSAISVLGERYPKNRGFALAIDGLGAHLGDILAPLTIGFLLAYLSWRKVVFLNLVPGLIIGIILWKFLFSRGRLEKEGKKGETNLKDYWKGVKTLIRNKNLLLLSVVSGIRTMTHNGLFTFLPIYLVNDWKLSAAMTGVYLAILRGAGIFASPFSGTASDTLGRKPLLTSGLVLTSFMLFVLLLLKIQLLFVIGLGLLGFFLYSLRPVIFAWTMDVTPKEMGGTTISIIFEVQSIFSSLSPVICGFIADKYGLISAFYFLAFTILLANLLVITIPQEKKLRGEEKDYGNKMQNPF